MIGSALKHVAHSAAHAVFAADRSDFGHDSAPCFRPIEPAQFENAGHAQKIAAFDVIKHDDCPFLSERQQGAHGMVNISGGIRSPYAAKPLEYDVSGVALGVSKALRRTQIAHHRFPGPIDPTEVSHA